MSNISRRQFFGSTAAVAAVGLTGAAHAADLCSIPKKWDKTVDVIIVGAGGAGLAAAITALEKGAKVAILEKLGMPGGNTMVSGGGMNGAIVEEAKKAGIEDSPKLHTEQTLAAGDFRADPALVAQYAEKMPETVEWFRKLGVTFTPIYQIYGGLWPRCRNPQGQKGYAYIEAMLKRLKELKGEVLTGHKVTAFIRENPSEGRVLGVEVEVKGKKEYWRATKGVVASAGGYAYNAEMCAYFDPRLTKLSTTNQPGATGEVLVAMQDIGALAIGLDYIQCIPGTAPGYKSKGNLIQVIEYSIFVNKEGKRFVNELERRDVLSRAALAQPDGVFYRITTVKNAKVDENGITAQGQSIKSLLKAKKVYEAPTIEELAKKVGMDPKVLGETVAKWNDFCRKQTVDPDFGRASCTPNVTLYEGPYYAEMRAPAVHHTMGGVEVDAQTRVLDKNGKVIPGLYAAGEVTGGLHGTNRVGGNAIPDALGNGQKAGEIVMGVAR